MSIQVLTIVVPEPPNFSEIQAEFDQTAKQFNSSPEETRAGASASFEKRTQQHTLLSRAHSELLRLSEHCSMEPLTAFAESIRRDLTDGYMRLHQPTAFSILNIRFAKAWKKLSPPAFPFAEFLNLLELTSEFHFVIERTRTDARVFLPGWVQLVLMHKKEIEKYSKIINKEVEGPPVPPAVLPDFMEGLE